MNISGADLGWRIILPTVAAGAMAGVCVLWWHFQHVTNCLQQRLKQLSEQLKRKPGGPAESDGVDKTLGEIREKILEIERKIADTEKDDGNQDDVPTQVTDLTIKINANETQMSEMGLTLDASTKMIIQLQKETNNLRMEINGYHINAIKKDVDDLQSKMGKEDQTDSHAVHIDDGEEKKEVVVDHGAMVDNNIKQLEDIKKRLQVIEDAYISKDLLGDVNKRLDDIKRKNESDDKNEDSEEKKKLEKLQNEIDVIVSKFRIIEAKMSVFSSVDEEAEDNITVIQNKLKVFENDMKTVFLVQTDTDIMHTDIINIKMKIDTLNESLEITNLAEVMHELDKLKKQLDDVKTTPLPLDDDSSFVTHDELDKTISDQSEPLTVSLNGLTQSFDEFRESIQTQIEHLLSLHNDYNWVDFNLPVDDNNDLQSPRFNLNGYSLSLHMSRKRTQLDIYPQVHTGPIDHTLKWPLPYLFNITYCYSNGHKRLSEIFAPRAACIRRPTPSKNTSNDRYNTCCTSPISYGGGQLASIYITFDFGYRKQHKRHKSE